MIVAQTTPTHGYTYTWAQYLQNPTNPSGMCSPTVGTAVGAASDPSGGRWVVGSGGTIATQGNAPCYGSLAGQTLNAPIVGIATTPDGKGYWLVASDGGIFTFGDATFYGSMGGKYLAQAIAGMDALANGQGYRFVAADGGVFDFGSATFFGSMGGQSLSSPIVVMASDGNGYWLVGGSGSVFGY